MKKLLFFIPVLIFLTLVSTSVYGQKNQDMRPPVEKWSLTTMVGTITEIDKDTREVTVMGSEGNLITVTASDEVERFDEIAVGDIISFDYWTYILAEFRWPTPEELAEPLVVLAEAGKAPEGMDPAAVLGAVVKAVVTVEIINRPFMAVTIRGPRGNYMTIEMENQALIEQLNVGQVVILTYAEAVALSLTKVGTDD
jgi:hypothetical protein